MTADIPYCGLPPSPGELLLRFNLDPVLIGCLVALGAGHLLTMHGRQARTWAMLGWLVAAAALISPLCALSVALFAARVGQHMVLILLAAPLIALGLPGPARRPLTLWVATFAFLVALWVWHMPGPYGATFDSVAVYWTMHLTLAGSAVVLWRELLHHRATDTAQVFMAGLFTSVQMGLLGAVITFASRPLYYPHLLTAPLWSLTPLQDQQLGGTLMWVPGIALFLWAFVRSWQRLWVTLESPRRA